jgi:hypothetical protein
LSLNELVVLQTIIIVTYPSYREGRGCCKR